jgi:cell shape-determining protein MreD
MAKKQYEFKPDKEGPDLLSRLYLTQKQRRNLLKWGLYSIVLVLLSVVQDVLLCQVRIFGSTTDLVPCAIFTICILEGAEKGAPFTLGAILAYLFSGSTAGFHVVPIMTFLAIGVTVFRQSYLQKGFSATFLCTALAMLAYEMVVFFIAMMLGQTPPARWSVAFVCAVLSMLLTPVLYPILISIGKIGGETWKE